MAKSWSDSRARKIVLSVSGRTPSWVGACDTPEEAWEMAVEYRRRNPSVRLGDVEVRWQDSEKLIGRY